MSRKARRYSITDIYHIVLKGTGNIDFFEDDNDRKSFIKKLVKYKDKYNYEIYAYCLMENHVHILIKVDSDILENAFKSIECSFVFAYNKKYERHGHLFQDRFYSETVETDRYFLTVLRYILRNPIKAGKCKKVKDYKWSSAKEYYAGKGDISSIEKGLEIAGSKENLINFINEDIYDQCLEIKQNRKLLDDEKGLEILRKITKCKSITEFQNLNKKKKQEYIYLLYKNGLYKSQITRLSGTPNTTVRRIISEYENKLEN